MKGGSTKKAWCASSPLPPTQKNITSLCLILVIRYTKKKLSQNNYQLDNQERNMFFFILPLALIILELRGIYIDKCLIIYKRCMY